MLEPRRAGQDPAEAVHFQTADPLVRQLVRLMDLSDGDVRQDFRRADSHEIAAALKRIGEPFAELADVN